MEGGKCFATHHTHVISTPDFHEAALFIWKTFGLRCDFVLTNFVGIGSVLLEVKFWDDSFQCDAFGEFYV